MTERRHAKHLHRFCCWTGLLGVLLLLPRAAALNAQAAPPWVVPEAAKKVKNPVKSSPMVLTAGAQLFRENCMVCHGETGAGNGPTAETLTIKPTDFNDAKVMNRMTDGELFWKISKGRGAMLAWGDQLSETDRWELVDYIRTLAHKGAR